MYLYLYLHVWACTVCNFISGIIIISSWQLSAEIELPYHIRMHPGWPRMQVIAESALLHVHACYVNDVTYFTCVVHLVTLCILQGPHLLPCLLTHRTPLMLKSERVFVTCFTLRVDLTDFAWQQAQLSLKYGGLGLHSISLYSCAAYNVCATGYVGEDDHAPICPSY